MIISTSIKIIFKCSCIYLLILSITYATTTFAFTINPRSNFDEKVGEYSQNLFGSVMNVPPQHENLIIQSIELIKEDLKKEELIKSPQKFSSQLVEGIRWNDDPLRLIENHFILYGIYYKHSCKTIISLKINSEYDYMYRSHCGDLQFWHAMSSSISETREETLDKIMMWLEFTYKVSSGIIDTNHRLRSVHKKLSSKSQLLFFNIILGQGEKYKCNEQELDKMECGEVETLFNRTCLRNISLSNLYSIGKLTNSVCKDIDDMDSDRIRNIALGSALHILQDSMSDSHVLRVGDNDKFCSSLKRKKGVVKFLNYSTQNHTHHKEADRVLCESSGDDLDLIKIVADFIKLSLQDRKKNTNNREDATDNWNKVSENLKNNILAEANKVDETSSNINKYNR